MQHVHHVTAHVQSAMTESAAELVLVERAMIESHCAASFCQRLELGAHAVEQNSRLHSHVCCHEIFSIASMSPTEVIEDSISSRKASEDRNVH